MKLVRLLAFACGGLCGLLTAFAQVPQIISYQGRVTAGGTNFDGTGWFKFALVSGATNASAQAQATATVSFGFLVNISVTSPGAGYTAPPIVTISDPTGSGAVAVANVAAGRVLSITVLDAGGDYSAPTVTIGPPTAAFHYTTFWSNDDSSGAGSEPGTAVAIPVANGLFSVLLGDASLSNMTAIPVTVFAQSDVRLRIWFSDGASTFQQLSPDQRIAAVGYAMIAASVPDGSITAAKLADASITATKLAPATRQELATPSGSVVLCDDPDSTNLIAAGYTRLTSTRVLTEEWKATPIRNQIPTPYRNGSLLWTGSGLIVWGGADYYNSYNTGARYSLASNVWATTSVPNAPEGRSYHSAVWTGAEMIIWGGTSRTAFLNSGGRYNPVSDRWLPMTLSNAPSARAFPAAVWSGTEMIVWGGGGGLIDGARYNPTTDTWTPISTNGVPFRSGTASALWTGTEMVVWGGFDRNERPVNTALYSPASDTWRVLESVSVPPMWSWCIWIGQELIAWNSDTAGRCDPATGFCASVNCPPYLQTGVWTGRDVIAFRRGGVATGGVRYSPAENQWSPVANANAPTTVAGCSAENAPSLFWTGSAVLCVSSDFSTLYTYKPSPPLYLYQKR